MEGKLAAPLSDERAANALLRVMDKVHDYAMFLMDENGIILKWNEAATVMKGYSAEEAVGSFFGILYTDEDRQNERPQRNLERAAKEGAFQEESWRRRKDGSLFWALIELIALYSDDGKLYGFCKITRDRMEGKELQDQLAAERERALVTLGAIGEAVLSIDVSGKLEYLNAVAEQLTGWTNEDAFGLPLGTVFNVFDESSAWLRAQKLVELVQTGDRLLPANTAVLRSKSGKQYDIEDTASPHPPTRWKNCRGCSHIS
jgi:PAS domain S-box-containing protein